MKLQRDIHFYAARHFLKLSQLLWGNKKYEFIPGHLPGKFYFITSIDKIKNAFLKKKAFYFKRKVVLRY